MPWVQDELGTLFVPENRAAAHSRIIGVGFARIKASRPTSAPPVFVLPGGPARSYLNAFTGGDAAAKKQLAGIVPYTAVGDVVVVDQRGYSKRGEELLGLEDFRASLLMSPEAWPTFVLSLLPRPAGSHLPEAAVSARKPFETLGAGAT
ncbi:hypothetical protein POL68_20340 [Stigmatella sp. ncwal1]|uniref:Uncharacterized protein n=1 Tax=Stigmatella ashevillensis TaxID=2995309 RepID=A0ABT5DES4_9BACT|nr:hypothetical protein [Stigmatella ashevillena]MDC0710836.1 hypothetical protein [Stigmatella ashevillena]